MLAAGDDSLVVAVGRGHGAEAGQSISSCPWRGDANRAMPSASATSPIRWRLLKNVA